MIYHILHEHFIIKNRIDNMKKILIYIFILILMCFSLPIIFTAEFSDRLQNTDSAALTNEITEEGNVSNTTEQKTESTYDYAKYRILSSFTKIVKKLKLFHWTSIYMEWFQQKCQHLLRKRLLRRKLL